MPFSIVQLLFDILETALVIRLLLLFFTANPESGFARLIYGLTRPFVAPFASLFPATAIGSFSIDWPTVVAIIAYAILSAIVMRLLHLLVSSFDSPPSTNNAQQ